MDPKNKKRFPLFLNGLLLLMRNNSNHFLELANYYRYFIPGLAALTHPFHPLHFLLKKKK
jgi:hypothetical protein